MNDQRDVIILSLRDYREKDALMNVLSKDGKQSMIARGLNKPNSKNVGALQPFTYARIIYNGSETRTLHTIQSATCLQSHRHIREDLLRSALAAIMCELVEIHDILDDDNSFEILKTCLDAMDCDNSPYGVFCLFLALQLRHQGIYPEVESCVRCQISTQIQAISIRDGGFICANCYQPSHDLLRSKEQLKKFRLINHAELSHLDIICSCAKWDYEDASSLLNLFHEYGGIRLKSMKFLENIVNLPQ